MTIDDTGAPVGAPPEVRRVVSLVPSLTETLAEAAPGLLVGATDWCTHPEGLDVARVRGTKNPDLDAIAALHPDLVVANTEENRPADLTALREAGIPVWVGRIESLDDAFGSLERMLGCAGVDPPAWLAKARTLWAEPLPGARRRAAVPVWRRPWMVAGAETFTTDVLGHLGVDNVFDDPPVDAAGRYPKAKPAEMRRRGAELIVLPDEPYAFSTTDGPEEFTGLDVVLVSGRHLTWYGPSMVEAHAALTAALADPLRP